jgi:hypothetical protein
VARQPKRQSDRWVTPETVRSGLRWVSLVILVLIGAVTWLVSIGRDPSPLLEAIGAVVTAVTAVSGVILQMANRATVTKVERNTAPLVPGGVPVVLEAVTDRLGRHGSRPPVPPNRLSTDY